MRMDLMEAVEEMGHLDLVFEALNKVERYSNTTAEDILDYLETCIAVSNGRPTTRAGQWNPSKRQVEVHAKLLEKGREAELASTFLHEVAHAITDFVYPSTVFNKVQAHGRQWKAVMRCLNQEPDRTCNFDFLQSEATANYVYGCVCGCGNEIFKQRKKKHPPKFTFFKECKGQLYLKRDNKLGRSYPNPGRQEITKEERIARAMNTTRRRRRPRIW